MHEYCSVANKNGKTFERKLKHMKEILESIILNMVDNKQEVEITEKSDNKTITLEVKVAAEDMGKVIGKQGKIAKAIRTVMKSLAAKDHKKVSIEFID